MENRTGNKYKVIVYLVITDQEIKYPEIQDNIEIKGKDELEYLEVTPTKNTTTGKSKTRIGQTQMYINGPKV